MTVAMPYSHASMGGASNEVTGVAGVALGGVTGYFAAVGAADPVTAVTVGLFTGLLTILGLKAYRATQKPSAPAYTNG